VVAAGVATAQDQPRERSAPTSEQKQPSASVSKAAQRHLLPGTLAAFDVERGTITFKDESGKSLTWPIEMRLVEHARAYAEMRRETLKQGDRVIVIYVVNAAGEPRVYDVKPAVRRGAGQQRRDEVRPPVAPTSPAPPP
jgi:Cu/Ag efflux protein CusF